MDNLELFKERYRQYMQVMNRADTTVNRYQRFLEHFILFLSQINIKDVQDIRKEHIANYQKEVFYQLNRKGQQNLPQTRNNYLKAIKSFCIFLKLEGYIVNDPAKEITYAKTPERLPRTILNIKEVEKIFKQTDCHNPLGYRDRAILEVLYSTGIRRQELLNLKPEDIDYEKGFLRVNRGKGDKDRIVPIGKTACKYIENYIKLVRIDFKRIKQSKYLFLSKRGNRLSEPALKYLINKYTKKANINKNISPHVFRHTCATHLIQQKANIRCVQEILGHKSLDTTQKYTQITITDLKEAHERCHPREREKEF
ncbi:MAG: site-specific tyrosine recombinase/integron integrase [Candidatus Omnitrophota bacterium]